MIAEETRNLLRRAQAGDTAAAEQMVTENTGLIWSVARRFFGRGVEPDDLYHSSESSEAAIKGRAAFLAPLILILPFNGTPPTIRTDRSKEA